MGLGFDSHPIVQGIQRLDPTLGLAVLDSHFHYVWMNDVQCALYRKLTGADFHPRSKEPCYKLWNNFTEPCSWCPVLVTKQDGAVNFGTVASPNARNNILEYSDVCAIPITYRAARFYLEVIRVVTKREADTETRLLSTIQQIDRIARTLIGIRDREILYDFLLVCLTSQKGLGYKQARLYFTADADRYLCDATSLVHKTVEQRRLASIVDQVCDQILARTDSQMAEERWVDYKQYVHCETVRAAGDDIRKQLMQCPLYTTPIVIGPHLATITLRDAQRRLHAQLVVHLDPKNQLFRVDELALLSLLSSRTGPAFASVSHAEKWTNAVRNIEKRWGQSDLRAISRLQMAGVGLEHDIFSPWNDLKSSIDILECNIKDPNKPSVRVAVDTIRVAKKFMDSCAKLTFDSFKLMHTSPGTVNVCVVAEEIIDILSYWAREGGVSIKNQIPPDLEVRCDERHLRRILFNLGRNALDALVACGHRKAKIELRASIKERWVVITCKDNGPGIADEIRPHVFNPFFTTKPEGNGVGLTTVKDLIERNGGVISVDSEWGFWTQFTIKLPAVGA